VNAPPDPSGAARGGDRPPLTLGTAGHVDHGKTALVRRLTGVDTDRLPEEQARGLSIVLGYARLDLPGGRRLSVVDVPGHERFVRTMVAGATGIDLFLMVVAADDGVMPQTREHAEVLRALGVTAGLIAITKADLADPARALAEARELLPGVPAVPCSARTGTGVDAVVAELERVAAGVPGRAGVAAGPVLHVDRVFTVRGAGTVVTGTLWSGAVERGATVAVRPVGLRARVRSVHVHDEPVERAEAGQRVALNLAGVPVDRVARGDVVCDPALGPSPSHRVDAALHLRRIPPPRVHVHHGARDAPARLVPLGGDLWQVRLEQPLLAARGDHLVIRSVAPPDTLGGGVVLDPAPRRHGADPAVLARLDALRAGGERVVAGDKPVTAGDELIGAADDVVTADKSVTAGDELIGAAGERAFAAGEPVVAADKPVVTTAAEATGPLSPAALALERRLLEAGHEPPSAAELGDAAAELPALRAAGRAVRVGRSMYAHPEALAAVRARVEAIIGAEGAITLARLRDELGTSRKYAQALLEHLDAARVTLRLPDDRRVLRQR
jgi:selenocysteine-specific elongation factor